MDRPSETIAASRWARGASRSLFDDCAPAAAALVGCAGARDRRLSSCRSDVRRGRRAGEPVRAVQDPLRPVAGSGRDTGVGRRDGQIRRARVLRRLPRSADGRIRSHSPGPGISWAGSVLVAARPVRRPRGASPRHRPSAGRNHPTSRQRCRCAAAVSANRTGQCRGTRAVPPVRFHDQCRPRDAEPQHRQIAIL